MFDHSDDTAVRRPRRVEVMTGPERRRAWPDAEKIAIVAQALEPGVNVSEIARRHDVDKDGNTALDLVVEEADSDDRVEALLKSQMKSRAL